MSAETLCFGAASPIIELLGTMRGSMGGGHVEDKLGYLSEVDLFQNLSEREVAELDRLTTITSVARGKVFYQPEDVSEVLFLLRQGRVQVYRISAEGKKLVIATLGPGTIFGEMALLGQQMHHAFAEALDDCVILVMSRGDLERLILERPSVGLRLLEISGQRLRNAERQLEEMAFKSIPARLASLLLRLSEDRGNAEIVGLTHQDLAEMIGTYRETATQVLNDMKVQGLIEIGRKRVRIADQARLRELAEPG